MDLGEKFGNEMPTWWRHWTALQGKCVALAILVVLLASCAESSSNNTIQDEQTPAQFSLKPEPGSEQSQGTAPFEELGLAEARRRISSPSEKLRLVHLWATW